MKGTLQIVAVPDARALALQTQRVIDNPYQTYQTHPIRLRSDARARASTFAQSPGDALWRDRSAWQGDLGIKHVVFIVKENRTFDQVFGARPRVNGDASLAELGGRVSPNHQALADRFTLFNNFYCDSDQSNTGHRWVVGVYPNEWVEVNARSRIEARLFSTAPGRRYVAGSSATILPEDYNEAGALWEHLARHGVPFFNFGFGTEMPASLELQLFKETGIR